MAEDSISWEECESALLGLMTKYNTGRPRVCFRGQANSAWPLKTTLERRQTDTCTIYSYIDLMRRIASEHSAFTGSQWQLPELTKLRLEIDAMRSKEICDLLRGTTAYPFMAHLRHHGFPSPLLDWTRSPYIAAYFAFAKPGEPTGTVAIYAFVEMPLNEIKSWVSDKPWIFGLGGNVRTHKRHFKQQSQYTTCVVNAADGEWRFASHQDVIDRKNPTQDLLYRFVVRSNERQKVLGRLEQFNLNAFSLFDSEEALLETLAIRHLDLRGSTG